MLPRIYSDLDQILTIGKVIVLYGSRRVGKTTLLQNYLKKTSFKYKVDNGDNILTREVLSSHNFEKINQYVEGYELIVIDEAQRIPDVGLGLKIMIDQNPHLRVIVTGSASLNLSYKVGEPLVGRMFTYNLFPLSMIELKLKKNSFELAQQKENFMIYGSYPEVVEAKTLSERRQLLTELVNSQLLKDIFDLEKLKKPRVILDLLKLIAFQVGSEVSLSELARSLEVDKKTVARYLWLLEQVFVLYRVGGFSRNLRKEITKMDKYYFYDNGVRNAIINNFNDFKTRDDVGQLWENFVLMERLKKQSYQKIYTSNYFWRTWDQKEVDWVEMREGKLFGFEVKWGRGRSEKSKQEWLSTYREAEYVVVDQDNYLDFVS